MTNRKDSRRILGFSDSPSVFVAQWQDPVFFKLMLSLTDVANPRAYYIGAASGEDPKRIEKFLDLAKECSCQPAIFRLFSMTEENPDAYFQDADVIFIDGGVTRNLLALLNEWQVIPALQRAYESGVLLAGASAGVSMLFEWYITDSLKTKIQAKQGIGLLPGTICVHYDVRKERQHVLADLLCLEVPPVPAFSLEDGTAVLFENEAVSRMFSTKPEASIFEFIGSGEKLNHFPLYLDSSSLESYKDASGKK